MLFFFLTALQERHGGALLQASSYDPVWNTDANITSAQN